MSGKVSLPGTPFRDVLPIRVDVCLDLCEKRRVLGLEEVMEAPLRLEELLDGLAIADLDEASLRALCTKLLGDVADVAGARPGRMPLEM